jgi:hypothetical protein
MLLTVCSIKLVDLRSRVGAPDLLQVLGSFCRCVHLTKSGSLWPISIKWSRCSGNWNLPMTNRGLFLYYAMLTVSIAAGMYLGWYW